MSVYAPEIVNLALPLDAAILKGGLKWYVLAVCL